VTLGLIWQGMGPEALAFGVVAEAATELVCLAFIDRRLSLALPSFAGAKSVWAFCSQLTGAQLSTRSAAALEPLLIGAVQGLAMTAFYNRGNRVVRTFRSGIEQATLPIALGHFSQAKGDRAAIRAAYMRAVALLTGLSWPVLAVFIILAEPMILMLFGDQWGQAVPLGQILGVGAIIYAASALSQQVHAALGEAALLMKRDAGLAVIRIIVLLVTAFISTAAVAWGLVAVIALSQIVHLHLLRGSIGLTYADTGQTIWKSAFMAAACAAAVAWGYAWAPVHLAHWQVIVMGGAVAAAVWLVTAAIVRHPLLEELQLMLGRFGRRDAAT
jgi:O-antigen/teichoic acid export membrane protein